MTNKNVIVKFGSASALYTTNNDYITVGDIRRDRKIQCYLSYPENVTFLRGPRKEDGEEHAVAVSDSDNINDGEQLIVTPAASTKGI